ncbi:MAG: hypothetical protein ABWK15_09230 [Dissulfuribacterales bacterium]
MTTIQDAPKANIMQVFSPSSEKQNARIQNFEDLVTILRTHPAWLEEIRRLVLSDELMQLPKKFDDFVKNEFHPLRQKVDHLDQKVDHIEQRVERVEERLDRVDQRLDHVDQRLGHVEQRLGHVEYDVDSLKKDVAELKGDNFERKVREKAPSYFGRLIKRCRVWNNESLADALDDAMDKGIVSESEREDALKADVVATGILRSENKEVVLVAEVSMKVDKVDVERADRRGQIISRVLNRPYLAVSIGRDSTEGAVATAKELDVMLI